jgi:hypothetical protein
VFITTRSVGRAAWAKLGTLAVDGDFHRTFHDEEQLVAGMPMRGMGCTSSWQDRFVNLHWHGVVAFAHHEPPEFRSVIGLFYWEFFEIGGLRRDASFIRIQAKSEEREQTTQLTAGDSHNFLRKEIAAIVKLVSKMKTTPSGLQFNLRHVRGSRRPFGFLHFLSLDVRRRFFDAIE